MAGIKDLETGALMAELYRRLEDMGCAYLIAVQKEPSARPGLLGQVIWNFPPGTDPSMITSAYSMEFGLDKLFQAVLPKGKWELLSESEVGRKVSEAEQSDSAKIELRELKIKKSGCIFDGENLHR